MPSHLHGVDRCVFWSQPAAASLSSCSLGDNDESVRYRRTPMRLMRPCAFANDERANRSSASLCRSPITYVGFSAAGAACPMARSQDPHSVRWPACWQAAYSRSAWSEIFVDSPARPTRPPIPAISRAACSRSGVGVGWPRVAGTARNARVGSRRCGGDDVL